MSQPLFVAGLALWFGAPTLAQNDISWLSFVREDSRLSGAVNLTTGDVQEKDYAWGDLDGDGDDDLVSVRKEPFTSSGRFPNVLLMNEAGVLTDRTAQYASASDVPGDEGFLTATNDRDVVLVDVDLDGWLDVVTATTLSAGEPKHVSHPRIYMNLGQDGSGNWLGLMMQDARFPQLFAGSTATWPRFCGVGAGDVTGNGYPDLYFADYDSGGSGGGDLQDRLLINDGNGFFTDESSARMSAVMLSSGFGTSATIVDVNGDGHADVVDGESGKVAVYYNDPDDVGTFDLLDNPYGGAPYHVNTGDLNQDGMVDLIVTDDGADRYLLNEGPDVFGRATWSPAYTYNTDDGFGSDNLVVDLDGDGWPETLYADVDVDVPGCERRAHIFHNRGGVVGGFVDLHEESGGGSTGVTGLSQVMMRGVHDIAAFDLEGDGDIDLIFGRCIGTNVWLNQLDPDPPVIGSNYCNPAAPNSTGQAASISGTGSALVSDNNFSLVASQLPPNQFGYFVTSETQGFFPMVGGSQGNLCLAGTLGRFVQAVQNSGSQGTFSIPVDLTNLPGPIGGSVSAGETWNFTAWFRDANPTSTSNFTNGLSVQFQ